MLEMYDSYGDGWNDTYFTLMDSDGNVVLETTFDKWNLR